MGLNTDRSVRQIKGEKTAHRPRERNGRKSYLPWSLWITWSPSMNRTLFLIESLKPHILVKGADWGKDKIIGREIVEKTGGRSCGFLWSREPPAQE